MYATSNESPKANEAFEGDDTRSVREILDADKEGKKQAFWASSSGGEINWEAQGEISDRVEPGLYQCTQSDTYGPLLRKRSAQTDDLIMVDQNGPMETVVGEIEHFWKPEIRARYEQRGFLYKRGILMYGDPGSGKTATVQLLIQSVVGRGGIALYSESASVLIECLQMVRRIEPEKPIVVVLEDFEVLTGRGRDENMWLSVMDGESQIDNVVFLATTNYVEQLDKRFTNRPSRFDVVVPVYMPSALTRATFLRRKEPTMTLEEIQHWVSVSEGYSIAHLKELMISVMVLGKNLDDEIKRIKEMQNWKNRTNENMSKSPDDEGTGFRRNAETDPREVVDWETFATENDIEPAKEDAA